MKGKPRYTHQQKKALKRNISRVHECKANHYEFGYEWLDSSRNRLTKIVNDEVTYITKSKYGRITKETTDLSTHENELCICCKERERDGSELICHKC